MSDKLTIPLDTIMKRASQVLKENILPSHDAFTVSEVLGACLGLPKEYVIDQIIKD